MAHLSRWYLWCFFTVTALNHVSFQIRQSDLEGVSPQQHRQLNQLEALMTDSTQTAGRLKPLRDKGIEPNMNF